MERLFFRFPSGRTFLIVDDISKVKKNRKAYVVFWNEEVLKNYFDIEAKTDSLGCYCYYASPTKFGIKNLTGRDGNFFVILCGEKNFKDTIMEGMSECFNMTAEQREFLILSEEPAQNGNIIDITHALCPYFSVFIDDRFYPVTYSPFAYHSFDYKSDIQEEILSMGDEVDFTIAYLHNHKITVSPNFGELEDFYEIDQMDRLINKIMGHLQKKDVVVLRDYNVYSMITNYTKQFPAIETVKHVYSHLANVMFDNGFRKENGIGVVYDSLSYGMQDQILGSEVIFGTIGNYKVVGKWKSVPLPGGDIANIEPWRIALAIIKESLGCDLYDVDVPLVKNLRSNPSYKYMVDAINYGNIAYTLSSSMHHILAAVGELFDFEASIFDFDFFENMLDKYFIEHYTGDYYQIPILLEEERYYIDTYALFKHLLQDLQSGESMDSLVYKTIFTIAHSTGELVAKISEINKEKKVFLSGEFFKHPHFLSVIQKELSSRGFEVYIHKSIPVDDSAIPVGQILYYTHMKKG